MNQKLLKFLKKPQTTQTHLPKGNKPKSTLKIDTTPKNLPENKSKIIKSNNEIILDESGFHKENQDRITLLESKEPAENLQTQFSSLNYTNPLNKDANIDESSPTKLEKISHESFEGPLPEISRDFQNNQYGKPQQINSPLKFSPSRRPSKENLQNTMILNNSNNNNINLLNKDIILTISSNNNSFISSEYTRPKEKKKSGKEINKATKFSNNGNNAALSFKQKMQNASHHLKSTTIGEIPANTMIFDRKKTLTEVQEKNSEVDEIKYERKFPFPETEKPPIHPIKPKSMIPKFYHHFVCQRIFCEKSFAQQQSDRRNSPSLGRNKQKSPSKSTSRKSYESSKKLLKHEIYDFYINLLQAIEKVRFNVHSSPETTESNEDYTLDYIVNFEELAVEEKEKEIYNAITAKFGKAFFYLIKKIFLIYALKKADEMVLSLRQVLKFAKDFLLFKKIHGFSAVNVQLMFSRMVQGKTYCNLRQFIEILFQIAKISQIDAFPKKEQNDQFFFKKFIEEYLVPCYRQINLMSLVFNVDNIQVFYKGQNPYENPLVSLLFDNDDLLKHVFSLYESFDLQKSERPFISLKDLLRFCKEYALIPYVCSGNQVLKVFLLFKEGNNETLSFKEFIMVLCCIAHIGQWKLEKNRGFYERMLKLFNTINRANNGISDRLVLKKII